MPRRSSSMTGSSSILVGFRASQHDRPPIESTKCRNASIIRSLQSTTLNTCSMVILPSPLLPHLFSIAAVHLTLDFNIADIRAIRSQDAGCGGASSSLQRARYDSMAAIHGPEPRNEHDAVPPNAHHRVASASGACSPLGQFLLPDRAGTQGLAAIYHCPGARWRCGVRTPHGPPGRRNAPAPRSAPAHRP